MEGIANRLSFQYGTSAGRPTVGTRWHNHHNNNNNGDTRSRRSKVGLTRIQKQPRRQHVPAPQQQAAPKRSSCTVHATHARPHNHATQGRATSSTRRHLWTGGDGNDRVGHDGNDRRPQGWNHFVPEASSNTRQQRQQARTHTHTHSHSMVTNRWCVALGSKDSRNSFAHLSLFASPAFTGGSQSVVGRCRTSTDQTTPLWQNKLQHQVIVWTRLSERIKAIRMMNCTIQLLLLLLLVLATTTSCTEAKKVSARDDDDGGGGGGDGASPFSQSSRQYLRQRRLTFQSTVTTNYTVRLYVALQYLNDATAPPLETRNASNPIVSFFCQQENKQVGVRSVSRRWLRMARRV